MLDDLPVRLFELVALGYVRGRASIALKRALGIENRSRACTYQQLRTAPVSIVESKISERSTGIQMHLEILPRPRFIQINAKIRPRRTTHNRCRGIVEPPAQFLRDPGDSVVRIELPIPIRRRCGEIAKAVFVQLTPGNFALERFQHLPECGRELADLIVTLNVDVDIEVPRVHMLGGSGEPTHTPRQHVTDHEARRSGD